jgi:hypothetical protein
MARSIKEIADSIKNAFIKNDTLKRVYGITDTKTYDEQFSDASVESVLIYIFATAVASLENIFDYFRRDVSRIVENERYGRKGWYEAKARAFQLGYNLPDDSDIYSVIDEAEGVRIVKAAWCGDGTAIGYVDLKVANIANDEFVKLDSDEVISFTTYINRIKPAGVFINVIAEDADELAYKIDIYYNPLLMKMDGELINGGGKSVEKAIDTYLQSLDFNGEFITMKFVDFIQQAEGVAIVEVKGVWQKRVGYNWGTIDARHIPVSGFFTTKTQDAKDKIEITYKPVSIR